MTKKEASAYYNALYRVVTIVLLSDDPCRNTYILTKDELTVFLEGYGQHAEFVVTIECCDEKLRPPQTEP